MRFVQFLVTDDQTVKLRLSVDMILEDDNYVLTEEEEADFQRLSMFLGAVLQSPTSFAPTGARAAKVKSLLRRVKNPEAEPAGSANHTANKRTKRRDARIAASKARRANRRDAVANHNRVQQILEEERIEAEEAFAELEERIKDEPRVNVLNLQGQVVFADVPISMIQPAQLPEPAEAQPASSIQLPASAEKAAERAAG